MEGNTDLSRDIPTLLVRPKRNIVYISIIARNVPTVVDNVFEILDNFKIDVSEATVTTDFKRNEKIISFFADFSHSTLEDISFFSEIIERVDGVKSVKMSDPLMRGVTVADIEFPVTTFGGMLRAVILPEPLFAGLIRGTIKRFGPTGLLLLYEAGREVGFQVGELLKKFDVPIDKLLEGCLKILKSIGMLDPTTFEIKYTNEIIVRFRDCIECRNSADLVGNNPSANLVRGLIDGLLEEYYGREYLSVETKCQYKGDDFCEIITRPRSS